MKARFAVHNTRFTLDDDDDDDDVITDDVINGMNYSKNQ